MVAITGTWELDGDPIRLKVEGMSGVTGGTVRSDALLLPDVTWVRQ